MPRSSVKRHLAFNSLALLEMYVNGRIVTFYGKSSTAVNYGLCLVTFLRKSLCFLSPC